VGHKKHTTTSFVSALPNAGAVNGSHVMTRGGVEGLDGQIPVAPGWVLYLNDCGQHGIHGHFTDIIYVNVN